MILVIESSSWHMLGIVSNLENSGFKNRVLQAQTINEAVEHSRSNLISLIIIRDHFDETTKESLRDEDFFANTVQKLELDSPKLIVCIEHKNRLGRVEREIKHKPDVILDLQDPDFSKKLLEHTKALLD